MSDNLYWMETGSPVGPLTLIATDAALCRIEFGGFADREEQLCRWTARWFGPETELRPGPEHPVLRRASEQLERYFAGTDSRFDIELDMRGTPFQLRVWEALKEIPFGERRSYKQVAEAIGEPAAVRAVGGANNQNPVPVIVPCHRVIGASGKLVGYGGGLHVKEALLRLERGGEEVEQLEIY